MDNNLEPVRFKLHEVKKEPTLKLVKYKAEHLIEILSHPSQVKVREYVSDTDAISLQRHEHCFSVIKDGKAIASVGLMKYWEGRHEAWAFIIPGNRAAFLYIHNCVKRFLKYTNIRRIEATVDMNFMEGHRWALTLGFKVECKSLHAFGPTGNDHRLYVYLGRGF